MFLNHAVGDGGTRRARGRLPRMVEQAEAAGLIEDQRA